MKLKRITTKGGEVYFVDAKTGERVEVDARYTHSSQNSTSNTSMKNRFATLLSLGQFVTAVGWLIFVAATITVIAGIASTSSELKIIIIVGGVIYLINGILVVAIVQVISCFVSIENNTYETNNILKTFKASIADSGIGANE